MTLVQASRPDIGSRYALEDGVLGSVLDEYLQEVSGAGLPGFGGQSGDGRMTVEDAEPDSPPEEAEPSQRQGPATRQRQRPVAHQDWSPSDGSEDSSPRQKRPAARKRTGHHRAGRLSSRRTQELQEKNRQAQQRFRQRQREKVTELEDLVVDLNRQVEQLSHDNAQLEHRVGELSGQQSQHGDSGQLESEQTGSPKQEAGVLEDRALQDDLVLTVRPDRETVLAPAQLQELSVADLINIWKEYRQVLTGYITKGEPDSDDASSDRVKQLVYELMVLLMRVAVHNPVVTKAFVAGNMEHVGSFEAEDMHVWRDVMRLLELSQEQKQKMVELRHFFLAKLRGILDRRKAIHAAITDSLPEAYNARHAARQFLKGHQSLEQLKGNMREEHVLKLDWISTIFNHIWTPLQSARCLVLSWPYTPDTFAMACWVGVEQGDPTALRVCTLGTPLEARGDSGFQDVLMQTERQHSDPGMPPSASPGQHTAQQQHARSNSTPESMTHVDAPAPQHARTSSPHSATSPQMLAPPAMSRNSSSNLCSGSRSVAMPHTVKPQPHANGGMPQNAPGSADQQDPYLMPLPNSENFSFPPDVSLPPGIFPPLHVQSPLLMPSVHGMGQQQQQQQLHHHLMPTVSNYRG